MAWRLQVTEEGRAVDALAPGGEEGRGKLRKSTGRRKQPLIRGCPNGSTRTVGYRTPRGISGGPTRGTETS